MSSCVVCSIGLSATQKDNIFDEKVGDKTIAEVLSDIVEKQLQPNAVHSPLICKKCHKQVLEYDAVKTNLTNIKNKISSQYKDTETKSSPIPRIVSPVKRVVLSKSKLQPLPPDYVINLGKIATLAKTGVNMVSNSTTGLTIVKPKTTISKPEIQIGRKVASKDDLATITLNDMNKQLTDKDDSVLSLNVNLLPKDYLSTAALSKNLGKDEGNEESSMEIDDECELVQIETEDDYCDITEPDKDTGEQFINVSIETDQDSNEGQSKDKYVLGKLEILDDTEDEEQTILMAGEDGPILRVMSGQKILYEGGELSLVTEDDRNENEDEDNEDGQDSNDESQIELQVSGDEETANAIIAAAQEKGGAFIKVESGEMFRVKSVQSTSGTEIIDNTTLNIVGREGDQFKCLICEKNRDPSKSSELVLGDAASMTSHVKTEHFAKVYICVICNAVMRKRTEYTKHMQEHATQCKKTLGVNKGKFYECNLCLKKYNSRAQLAEHARAHAGRPHACSLCGKAFASKYTLQAHLKTHLERPRPFKCGSCDKSFLTQQNLAQHTKTHLGIKEFVCNVCGKAFGTQHNLEVHGVVHSGNKPFVCGVCGKAFARRPEVKDHMRIHTGERPFACDLCPATFSQRSNLLSHKRATHFNDRRYHCKECPKKFKRRRLLEYHIKATHTGERPLNCEICQSTFVYPEHYKKHIRIHSGEKPYTCEVCGKSFNSRDNRNTHRFVHSDKKPYECLVCGAGYMRKQLLYAHMNNTGHLAESIVVNQPRVHKVSENVITTQSVLVEANKPDRIEELFESTQDLELDVEDSKETVATPELVITNDKQLVLEGGKPTINLSLVQDSEDPTLLTLQNINGERKDPLSGVVQASADQMGDQMQQMIVTENGVVRLVQVQLQNGDSGWMALDQIT